MNQAIQIVLSISVLLIPIFFWVAFMTILDWRLKKVVNKYLDNSSEIFPDLKIRFKNFDVFKKKKTFDLSLNQTLYSFNRCDLISNENNFLVIGKTKFFWRMQAINAKIFESERNVKETKSNHVRIVNIQEVGEDLEIEFIDKKYSKKITMVIKRVKNELRQKIKTSYN